MKKFVLIGLVAAACTFGAHGSHVISMNSENNDFVHWQLCAQIDVLGISGKMLSTPGYQLKKGVDAIVPGVTFSAYVAAGVEDNPEWSDNIYLVDETKYNRPYWYRTEFATPAHAAGERVWLNFDNTHRYAAFFFNGVKLSGTDATTRDVSGHMMRTRYDVTNLLAAEGEANAVAVLITDPTQKKTRTAAGAYGNGASPSYMSAAGWDWMPYIPGRLSGITGNVYLRITGETVIDNPWVRGRRLDNGDGDVSVQATLKNVADQARDITLKGTITPGNIEFSKTFTVEANSELTVMVDHDDFPELIISNPSLWWPNGFGDQNLYTCTLETVADGVTTDSRDVSFGIRSYEWRTVKNSENYDVLQLYVNGKRVYVKGGNWGISEYLLRCHGEEYNTKLRLHKEMNYNMIRLWTGCVTDEEFYDYCDRYGMMVWDDFWLFYSFFGVDEPAAFKANAREKVLRLRNHPCIAMWCGANESHPADELDTYLRELITDADGNDRQYKSCSNDEGLSGSGWWSNQTPDRYFESASNALAFGDFRFTDTSGYGMRTEIGMGTFPNFESVNLFMPADKQWPLPSDDDLQNNDETIWNRHFFGKEGGNASPAQYKNTVNNQYGASSGLQEFCDKAQLLNIESMKGMYEAWNDKMWNDASGLLVWMSNPAYPSFLWQTYDYYYDTTGAYWGAKSGCELMHVQWNSHTGSVKVVNTTGEALNNATVTAQVFNASGKELTSAAQTATLSVPESSVKEAFTLAVKGGAASGIRFVLLKLTAADGTLLSRNCYWHNNASTYNYTALTTLPAADVDYTLEATDVDGVYNLTMENNSTAAVAFATRLRFVDAVSGDRILPVYMSDNFVSLMPGEVRTISVEAPVNLLNNCVNLLAKQFMKDETVVATTAADSGFSAPVADVASKFTVATPGNGVLTLGWSSGEQLAVRIYNAQGAEVLNARVESLQPLTLPSAGIYIVAVGGETLKVAVK
jgi:hypothetical protein